MSFPAVHIILPTYNRSHLLPDVIASILSQEYRDFELLIVDDGSTDQTEQLIQALQEQDGRLRYCKLSKNHGIGFARQAGLENVSGKYIALADSDDTWIAGKLRAQVEILEMYPEIDILFGDYININHITNREVSGFKHTAAGMLYLATRQIKEHLFLVESGIERGITIANFIAVPTMIIRSTLFKKTGGFNVDLPAAADFEFGFRAAALGARFAYLDYPLIYRHVYSDSRTSDVIKSVSMIIHAYTVAHDLSMSIHRGDLVAYVDRGLQRNYICLMEAHGKVGNRNQVWNSYRKVVSYGFSIRDFVYFLAFWVGPGFISFVQRFRGRKQS